LGKTLEGFKNIEEMVIRVKHENAEMKDRENKVNQECRKKELEKDILKKSISDLVDNQEIKVHV